MKHFTRHLRKFFWLLSRFLLEFFSGPRRTIVFPKSDWETHLRRFEMLFRHRYIFADDPASLDLATVDFVIPLSTESYERFINSPPVSQLLLAPPPAAVRICDDKASFHGFFSDELGAFLPPLGATRFPLMVKPSVGADSKGCEIIWDERQWAAFQERGMTGYVIEEYVPGEREYASHILANNGVMIDILCIEYVYDDPAPLKGSHPSYRRIVSERFPHIIERFLGKLSYTGFCCVNYKIRNNLPVILEINPRVGGSCCEYLFGFVRHLHKIDRIHGSH